MDFNDYVLDDYFQAICNNNISKIQNYNSGLDYCISNRWNIYTWNCDINNKFYTICYTGNYNNIGFSKFYTGLNIAYIFIRNYKILNCTYNK